jgi:hypothetical protein
MEDGGWRMEDGGWRMEDGGWRMEEGGVETLALGVIEALRIFHTCSPSELAPFVIISFMYAVDSSKDSCTFWKNGIGNENKKFGKPNLELNDNPIVHPTPTSHPEGKIRLK